GSIFLHAGVVADPGTNTLTIAGGYLSGSAQRGGGVFVSGGIGNVNGATFNMQSHVPAIPGGSPLVNTSPPTIGNPFGSPFSRGTATYDGGGVYVQGGTTAGNAGVFNMHTGSVGAADADGTRRGSIAHRNGGGLFLGSPQIPGGQFAQFNMPGTAPRSFIGNDADGSLMSTPNLNQGRGGGIFIPQGFPAVTLPTGTNINFNHARNGGGVWVGSASSLILSSNGVVRGNSANYDGGGLFISGGAIETIAGASFTMEGGIIGGANAVDSNRAERGGGVFVQSGSHGSTSNHGQFTQNSGDIRNNRAILGGGVFVGDGHTDLAVISGTGFDGYIGHAPYEIGITPANAFTGSGGRFTKNNGHIRYNIAGNSETVGNGGGVWVANYAYFHINSVTFNNNSAVGVIVDELPVGGMGGAIFTMRYEYRDPLRRIPGWGGASTTYAYTNLLLSGISNFSGNTAVIIELPPVNAAVAIATTLFGTTSQPSGVAIVHPINNRDINFMHRPEETIYFFSVDDRLYQEPNPFIYRLSGSQFLLFRTINPHVSEATFNADPDGRFVRFNNNGEALSNLWVEVPFANGNYVATSSLNPISFDFDGRFAYQIVQVMSVAGFQIPMGQWQVTYNANAAAGQNPINMVMIGQPSPLAFASTDSRFPVSTNHPILPVENNIWYIGSWRMVNLPMTGSIGSTVFIMTGGALVMVAAVLAMIIFTVKKNKRVIKAN
ncbi:MAG: hypothetical protein FWE42_08975, partial [Defluviitaleaceae bacterium]|nr:hypothetical protein [Defluviitaleaceae bacterium]